jgi:hypothetical protein
MDHSNSIPKVTLCISEDMKRDVIEEGCKPIMSLRPFRGRSDWGLSKPIPSLRQISNKRARKLKKKGVHVFYSNEHDSMVWTTREFLHRKIERYEREMDRMGFPVPFRLSAHTIY